MRSNRINPSSQSLWQVALANTKPKPAIVIGFLPTLTLPTLKKTKSFKTEKTV